MAPVKPTWPLGWQGVGGLMTFHDESAQARAQVCLTCHEKETERFQFRRSEHKLTGVACNDCHAPHFPTMPAGLLRQKTPELCFSCHREVGVPLPSQCITRCWKVPCAAPTAIHRTAARVVFPPRCTQRDLHPVPYRERRSIRL